MLHSLRKQGDEVRRAEVAAIHAEFGEVTCEVRHENRNQSVQPVEVLLQHGQLRVEERAQLVQVDHLAHDCEGKSLVAKEQVEEARNEVHPLAVVKVRIDHRIGEEYASQVLICDAFGRTERAVNVTFNLVLPLLGQV